MDVCGFGLVEFDSYVVELFWVFDVFVVVVLMGMFVDGSWVGMLCGVIGLVEGSVFLMVSSMVLLFL